MNAVAGDGGIAARRDARSRGTGRSGRAPRLHSRVNCFVPANAPFRFSSVLIFACSAISDLSITSAEGNPGNRDRSHRDAKSQMKFRQGDITMPVKTTIAAIAAFVAVAAAPGLASAKTVHHPTLHQRALQLPADAYGY